MKDREDGWRGRGRRGIMIPAGSNPIQLLYIYMYMYMYMAGRILYLYMPLWYTYIIQVNSVQLCLPTMH